MGELPQLAVVRETDDDLAHSISSQIKSLGVKTVSISKDYCPAIFTEGALRDAPASGILIVGIRDAILGPAQIAECRQQLPDWLIIVIDHIVDEYSSADALTAGADDVLRMPHPPREFAARLSLRMRQAGMMDGGTPPETPLFSQAQFTPVESQILRILNANKGEIVTRNQLSQQLDQSDWLYGDRKFDVHITKIRKKLHATFGERYLVQTIRSKGYLMQSPDGSDAS